MIGEKFGIFPSVWYAGLKCNYATDKYSYIVGIKVSNVVMLFAFACKSPLFFTQY
jgi:hypothetical protein